MSHLNFESLTQKIVETHHFFQKQVVRQVNTTLSLRNWLLGHYLVEYEQQGADRAIYGEKLYRSISKSLKEKGFILFDLQVINDHTRQFGTIEIPRSEYLQRLKEALQ